MDDNRDNRIIDCNPNYEYDVEAATLSTMKAGGKVARVYRPEDIGEFILAIRGTEKPFVVLGNGSNVVFTSKGYDGTIILTTKLNSITDTENGLECGAGASLSAVAARAAERGLTGLEFAYGIPGTVGGAICMNAGAYGGEIKDVLHSVGCVTADGQVVLLSAEECRLSYRHSLFSEMEMYIVGATFVLKQGDKEAIRAKMAENMARRKEKQPLEYPSCGSTFKRPTGLFAGKLIEDCGLKGFTVGGAQVSEKHAGFVINRGGASGDDVVALIKQVQDKVFAQTGVLLEPEVKIL